MLSYSTRQESSRTGEGRGWLAYLLNQDYDGPSGAPTNCPNWKVYERPPGSDPGLGQTNWVLQPEISASHSASLRKTKIFFPNASQAKNYLSYCRLY